MSAKIIDGKAFAEKLRGDIATRVEKLKKEKGITPGLAVVLVGNDPASEVYVRNKGKQAKEAGMNSFDFKLPASTSEKELLEKIAELNNDKKVHGILVQLPIPTHIDTHRIIDEVDPKKDVDGFTIHNIGLLGRGFAGAMIPCTPLGCLMLLKDTVGDLSGKHAVIVGRSNIVGKPMAQLLIKENCTVTITHSKTKDLPAVVKLADIVIAAVGKPQMVKGEWLKKGAVVIDVGINRVTLQGTSKLVGDVDFDSCLNIASAITPVPGGVGPMTIACLLENTLKAASS